MNKILTGIMAALLLVVAGCYKDKGNYTYDVPEDPIITNLDTVYAVFVGDSLIVKPTVTTTSKANLSFEWKIIVPEQLTELTYKGPEIRIIFGLSSSRYTARLTITNNDNGMKYFRNFFIDGKTGFSLGTVILSMEDNNSELSFIKPDGSVQARIYEALHNGEKLPGKPQQVVGILHQYITPTVFTSYWITGGEGANTGVQIDATTFKRIKYVSSNFFDPPAAVKIGQIECSAYGVLNGVFNEKLYVGTSQTWSGSTVYGMFGLPAEGDYALFSQAVFNPTMPYFLGYEKNRKQFVAFTNFGSPAYIGTGYQVTNTAAFNPVSVGMDMIYFTQVNGNNCFAFAKGTDGNIYELKFGAAFMGFVQLSPEYKRVFAQQSLITADTKWAASPSEIFYFSSNDKIYRYNPLNQETKPLTVDFGGKKVTMVKLIDGGNTLLAGVEGSFYHLDVSTGKMGDVLKKVDGIPGSPIDAVIKDK